MVYVYDFGDNWRHEVVLEKIVPSDARDRNISLGEHARLEIRGDAFNILNRA